MDSIFKICKNGNCGISIIGLEKDNSEYLDDTATMTSTRLYHYTDSITVNVLRSITADGEYTIRDTQLVTHVSTGIDQADVEFPIDGLYEIAHIILPTQSILTAASQYSKFYYFDEDSDTYKLYNTTTETGTEVTIEEILEINADALTNNLPTSIIRSDQNTFCLCYLNTCFYKICKELLSNFCGKCINKLNTPKQDIYNRDIIWMAINIIKYLISLNQYYEAQRILEAIIQCGNICANQEPQKGVGCGCHS